MRSGRLFVQATLDPRRDALESSLWPTPKVATGDYSYSGGNHEKPALNLEGAAKLWGTPTSRDWKDDGLTDETPTNGLLGRQVQRTPMAGAHGSQRVALSPLFVETLMGFPIEWTHRGLTAPTASAPLGTPSCQPKPSTPSSSSLAVR